MIGPQSMARLSLAATALALLVAQAAAAPTRFVSSSGSDSNDCSIATPCRTLQHGADTTPDDGELVVLDSGGYGDSLTITKSISIVADGVTATLGNPGSITINGESARFALRGLFLSGAGNPSTAGILVQEAATVHIDHCVIQGFEGQGIQIASTAAGAAIFVADSVSRDNGGSGLKNSSTSAHITVKESRFENNAGDGLVTVGGEVTIVRSIFSGNGVHGVEQTGAGRLNVSSSTAASNVRDGFKIHGSADQATLESSVARGNGRAGLEVLSGQTVRISNSLFSQNDIGIANTGTVFTRRNNTVAGNTTDLTGNALTSLSGT